MSRCTSTWNWSWSRTGARSNWVVSALCPPWAQRAWWAGLLLLGWSHSASLLSWVQENSWMEKCLLALAVSPPTHPPHHTPMVWGLSSHMLECPYVVWDLRCWAMRFEVWDLWIGVSAIEVWDLRFCVYDSRFVIWWLRSEILDLRCGASLVRIVLVCCWCWHLIFQISKLKPEMPGVS